MIKKFSLFVALILFSFSCYAQENIVKWNSNIVYVEGDTYQLQFEASIEKGWHMYDMGPYSWNGPNPTIINVEEANGGVAQDSTFQVDKQIKIYEELYESEIGFYENSARFAQNVKLSSDKASFKVYVEYMACNDTSCTPLMDSTFVFNINASEKASYKGDVFVPYSDAQKIEKTESEKPNKSIWALIIEAVLWGFAALLTPCVFPMIPMTVSFFMKGSGSSRAGRIKAFTFGLLIVLLYTLPIAIIIMATKILGGDAVTADIFNWLATHWIPNLIFFIVFMIFAASFFGAFEITLPSSMVNKSDQNSEKKGLAGLFFMALTLVLVSFSCTGPIVGSVLIKSTAGEFWEPIITMTAFSVAFALPFTIFAMFPSLLKNLPKSGGWLNSVKVVLGFIEVALGFKFLSIADQTYHWGLLDREVYLAIWIVVFSLLGLYLLGKLRFANDSEVKHITVGRLALAITSFTFVVYMIPGMFGAPLKALSGYMPPIHSQDFVLGENTTSKVSEKVNTGKYSDFLHLPHGLSGYFDLEEGMEVAKRENKPVFVDITGHGCVNCREMEARVWSDERVLEILRRDYIIVALYTDDKKEVAEEDWIKDEKGDVLKTLGRINSYIVRTKFAVNAQPNYALLDNDGNYLAPIRGYDLSVDGFIKFLEDGVKKYKSL